MSPPCDNPTEKLRNTIRIRNPVMRNALSEFFGTLMFTFIGTGIGMQMLLSRGTVNTSIHVNIGNGLALAFCVYMTAQTSGGHLNPAVSLMMFTLGKIPLGQFVIYWIAQTAGAFVGCILAFLLYYDQMMKYSGGRWLVVTSMGTAPCFTSFPAMHVSNATAIFDQVVGTAFLCMFICVITDKRNKIPDHVQPILVGTTLILVGMSAGMNLGYPINPARDFGPRLFAYFLYGSEVFTYHNNYFWIPLFVPFVGGVAGGWLYYVFVGSHIDNPKKQSIIKDIEQQGKLLREE